MRALVILILATIAFAATPARADDTSDVQRVIRSQTEAFEQDDGPAAWSYASPTIQNMFGRSDAFMGMVKNNYAPVVRHKSFEFRDTRANGDSVEQDVDIVDDDGVPWQALYTLAKQPDGSWKITGCMLKAVGQAA